MAYTEEHCEKMCNYWNDERAKAETAKRRADVRVFECDRNFSSWMEKWRAALPRKESQ